MDGGWTEAAVPGLPGARGQGAGQPRGPPMQRTQSRLAVFQAASPRPTRPHLMHALFRATSCVYDIGIHIRPPTRCPRRLRDSRKPRLLPARPPAHPAVPEGAGTGMTGSQGATRLLDKGRGRDHRRGHKSAPQSPQGGGCPPGPRRTLRRRTRSPSRSMPASRACPSRVATVTYGKRCFHTRNESRGAEGAELGPRSGWAPTACRARPTARHAGVGTRGRASPQRRLACPGQCHGRVPRPSARGMALGEAAARVSERAGKAGGRRTPPGSFLSLKSCS